MQYFRLVMRAGRAPKVAYSRGGDTYVVGCQSLREDEGCYIFDHGFYVDRVPISSVQAGIELTLEQARREVESPRPVPAPAPENGLSSLKIVVRGRHDVGKSTVANLMKMYLEEEGFRNVVVADNVPSLPAEQKDPLSVRLERNRGRPVLISVELEQ